MNRLYRWVLPLLLTPALGGCMDSQLMQRDPTVDRFYSLDSETLQLCRGLSKQCHSLITIAYSRELLPKIEQAYGSEITGPNYPLSLAQLMMNPPGGEYKTSTVDSNGRYLRLPVNDQTDTAWHVLEQAFNQIYDD